jgi:hypothetical protein
MIVDYAVTFGRRYLACRMVHRNRGCRLLAVPEMAVYVCLVVACATLLDSA